jgi:hypothetical protein
MRHRALILALCLVALVAAPTVAATSAARVPVTRCPTSYGVPSGHGPAIPKTVAVNVNATGLRAYSNGWLTVIAPAGWHCSGGVGADGNEDLTVLPLYVSQESAAAAAVSGSRQWNGEAIYTACPFFPELERGYSAPCPAIPKRELIDRLSARTVAFEDPPGVRGTGGPSGGAMPANGVVSYAYQGSNPKTKQLMVGSATCTLPQGQHSICTRVLNDFLARWTKVP